jgi:hypothetical protein
MRATVVRAVALLSLISFACAEKPKTVSSAPGLPQSSAPQAVASNTQKPNAPAQEAPTYPKGARYTIYCTTMTGPDHVERATNLKNELNKVTPYKNWYVVHQNDQSILYYGFYKTVRDEEDQKEADRAHKALAEVRGLQDKLLNRPFERAQLVPLDSPDPSAPAEWDLANAKGYWTIQIAAYKDSPERKQAAVDSVRALRQAGEQAYFYHGETTSSVCIGAWPKEAIKSQDAGVAAAPNPNDPIMVSTVPLPARLTQNMHDENGNKIQYMEAKVVIVDPTMAAVKRKYPNNAINGYVMQHKEKDMKGNDILVGDPSLIVHIPQPEPSQLGNMNIANGSTAPRPRPMLPDQSGIGAKLRSLGE